MSETESSLSRFTANAAGVQSHEVGLNVKGEIRGQGPRVRQSQQQLVAGSTAVVCAPRDAISWLCQS